jgi:SSS family solute:Na+ symporter
VQGLTLLLLLVYAGVLIGLSWQRRGTDAGDYLLDGRRLTLPAFVATLVTTWYGGILGVGEYAWSHGLATWLVFGVPYYLAAMVFAFGLAGRLRSTGAVSIPELLQRAYGPAASRTGALGVLAFSLPVAYLVMLGVLLADVTGWPRPAAVVVAALFSAGYVALSGFRAVVRTDRLQMVLMYGGFLILLPVAVHAVGGLDTLWERLPETHRSWDGGLGWQPVVVWYLIALQTIVDPTFYQRVFAAASPRTARRGVVVSVLFWMVFDALSVFTGLAARVLLPDLADPLEAYQSLAALVLPTGLAALFVIGLFATVMSTVDSYLFLAAATVGHDLLPDPDSPTVERRRMRWALIACAAVAAGAATLFTSAVAVWYGVGSVVTSALLLPVVAVHLPASLRPRPGAAVASMVVAAGLATIWFALGGWLGAPYAGIEPMFPALAGAVAVWGLDRLLARRPVAQR